MDANRIAEFRKLRGQGMTPAVGDYTPDEFWEALDALDALEQLRQAANCALVVLENLDECEMARLRGSADDAIKMLRAALK